MELKVDNFGKRSHVVCENNNYVCVYLNMMVIYVQREQLLVVNLHVKHELNHLHLESKHVKDF